MNYQKLFDTLQNMGITALETDMQEIVRAVESDAYNQGVRDAAESALLLHKELNFRNEIQQKELVTWGCDPKRVKIENMNEDDIFQGCQYIALYMGWDAERLRIYMTLKHPSRGKVAFNESWDLLMPVIEKIESEPTNKEEGEQFQFSISGDGVAITKYDDGSGVVACRVNEIGKSKLQSAFEVVATFCKLKLLKQDL